MNDSELQTPATLREKQYFTLAEANRTLPLVRRIMQDVAAVYRQIVELQSRVQRLVAEGKPDQAEDARDLIDPLVGRVQRYADELAEVGAQLKDPRLGLVDFSAIHEGREVLLCWRMGEESIRFWHEVSDGYSGRQSVDRLDARARG